MNEANNPYFPFDQFHYNKGVASASFVQDTPCEHMFKLEREDDCGTYEVSPIYVNIEFNEKVDYIKEEERNQDGYGKEKIVFRKVERVFEMRLFANKNMAKFIYEMLYSNNRIKLTDIGTSTELIIYDIEAEDDGISGDDNIREFTIRYKSEDVASEIYGFTACCLPIYDEAPYEDGCPPGSGEGEGEGPEPIDCSEFSNEINRVNDDLVITVNGAPTTSTTNWLYRPTPNSAWQQIATNASSISLGGYGEYRAVTITPECGQAVDNFGYPDPCVGFDVLIRRNGLFGLIAEMSFGYEGSDFAWEQYDSNTDTWSPIGGNNAAIVISESGTYRVTATFGDCEDQDVITVDISVSPEPEPCIFTASIVDQGDFLAVNTDCPTVTGYTWSVDRGDGLGFVSLGQVGSSIQKSGSGYYRVQVNGCEPCELFGFKLIIDEAEDCCDVTASISDIGDELKVSVFNCDDQPIIEWYINNGSGYKHITSGDTIGKSTNGMYKAVVSCGDCKAVNVFRLVVDCDECTDFEVALTEVEGKITALYDCSEGEGEGGGVITWILIDEDGETVLGETGDMITAEKEGVYRAEVNCGGCVAEASIVFCRETPCETCDIELYGVRGIHGIRVDDTIHPFSSEVNIRCDSGAVNEQGGIEAQIISILEDLGDCGSLSVDLECVTYNAPEMNPFGCDIDPLAGGEDWVKVTIKNTSLNVSGLVLSESTDCYLPANNLCCEGNVTIEPVFNADPFQFYFDVLSFTGDCEGETEERFWYRDTGSGFELFSQESTPDVPGEGNYILVLICGSCVYVSNVFQIVT